MRAFFRDSSFGVLRPALQDASAFEDAVARWAPQFESYLRSDHPRRADSKASPAFASERAAQLVRAKLLGRWPDGQRLSPGDYEPERHPSREKYRLLPGGSAAGDLHATDPLGEGCPFGSHVRRLHVGSAAVNSLRPPPLLRRSVPYGPALWSDASAVSAAAERGQIGHFFCADIESQFEELLANWSAATPRGFTRDDRALDPLIGPQDDPAAGFRVPLRGAAPEVLTDWRTFVRPWATVYAWYPGRDALDILLRDDFVPEEARGPWL